MPTNSTRHLVEKMTQGQREQQRRHWQQARTLYEDILREHPDHREARYQLANVHVALKNHALAISLYSDLIAQRDQSEDDQQFSAYLLGRAIAYKQTQALELAIADCDQVLKLTPHRVEAYSNRGNARRELRHWKEALDDLNHAIELRPDVAPLYLNRGVLHKDRKRYVEALEDFEQAIRLQAVYPAAYSNRGNTLKLLERYPEAIESLHVAIQQRPDYAEAYLNRGSAYFEAEQFDLASADFDTARQLNPQLHSARHNQSLVYLLRGDLAQAWPLYESRWETSQLRQQRRHFAQAAWNGDADLAGKTIFVYWEQGLGDTLQFCRYLPFLAARGARVICEVQAPLHSFLALQFQDSGDAIQFIPAGSPLPDFDLQCAMLSLPHAFATSLQSIPTAQPYLFADSDRQAQWESRLGPRSKPRIGLVWCGNPKHTNDHHRSLMLSQLLPFLPPEFTYVSLQKEVRRQDQAVLDSHPDILHFGEELVDFNDTAALCANLDCVISVDTSVAHLSAALGKPTWILLAKRPDWRWMLERDDSPWYASARLFRQTNANDWSTVFKSVASALISEFFPTPPANLSSAKLSSATTVFAQAKQLHQSGQLAEARLLYQTLLNAPPTTKSETDQVAANARYLLGMIGMQEQDYLQAIEHFQVLLSRDPAHRDALFQLAVAYNALGKTNEALMHYQTLVTHHPDDEPAHFNLGNVLQKVGQIEAAIASYSQAIEHNTHYLAARHNRAHAYLSMGQFALSSEDFDICYALASDPLDRLNAINGQGAVKLAQHDFAAAIHCFYEACELAPKDAKSQFNLGTALQQAGDLVRAIDHLTTSISLDDGQAEAYLNRATARMSLNQFNEAILDLDSAIARQNAYALAHYNRAIAYKELGQLDAAIRDYQACITIAPHFELAKLNLGIAYLLQGDFAPAWDLYESRLQQLPPSQPQFQALPHARAWDGEESLTGQIFLVYAEQGLGDSLQFCRYLPLLVERGAKVIFEAPANLHRLLQTLKGCGDTIHLLKPGEVRPDYALYCALLSLPRLFGTRLSTIPAEVNYLSPDPALREIWRDRLQQLQRKLNSAPNTRWIGLVCSGNAQHQNDGHRSIALRDLLPYLPLQSDHVRIVLLQKDIRAEDRSCLDDHPEILHFTEQLHDFADTAALCSYMDLIVSVDTSVAHLAGAIGKPCYVLLPFVPDWRWLQNGATSPWYPSLRLFRQTEFNQWTSCLQQLQQQLAHDMTPMKPPSPNDLSMHQAQLKKQFDTALQLHQAGQLERAKQIYEAILCENPRHVESLTLLGTIAAQKQDYPLAVKLLDHAISIHPEHAVAYSNRGIALDKLQQFTAALASFDRAIALQSNFADAYANRGITLRNLRRFPEAIASYNQALRLVPNKPDVLLNRGISQLDNKEFDAALASFDQALQIQANYPEAYSNRGVALTELRRLPEALTSFDQAIRLRPGYAGAFSNRATALRESNQLDAALASVNRALELDPDFSEAYSNRGNILRELKRIDASIASFDRAITLKPSNAQAYWNKSIALLQAGRFAEAWELYEWRWKTNDQKQRHHEHPRWTGKESIRGQRVLLHFEQGLGDTIQFCAYAKMVKALGAFVILEVQPPLASILQDVEGVDQLVVVGEPLPEFDFQCPLLSIPFALQSLPDQFPSKQPYLKANPSKIESWSGRMGTKQKPRIGLVWSGGTVHKNDRRRSAQLADLIPHLPPQFDYICLQKEIRESDRAALDRSEILFLGDDIKDFADTAALCCLVDAVVTVDTSVAHLSAALGRPTSILLAYTPDWRWLLERTDSPWYDSVSLFRQSIDHTWPPVFQQVFKSLASTLGTANPSGDQRDLRQNQTGTANSTVQERLQQAIHLQKQGKRDAAKTCYQDILQSEPNQFDALNLIASLLTEEREFDVALSFLERACLLKPHHAPTLLLKAICLHEAGRWEEALSTITQSLTIAPQRISAMLRKSAILQDLRRFDEALQCIDEVLLIQPDHADALYNRSFILRLLGDYELGWQLHESRWKKTGAQARVFTQPAWTGTESLQGKILLLYGEQGLGDMIQFSRYIHLLAKQGAQILLEVPSSLVSLFQDLPGIKQVISKGTALPHFDLHYPLLSLPLAFKTTLDSIPYPNAYLKAPTKRSKFWQNKLGIKTRPRIGLVWSGNPAHKNDHNRSLRLTELLKQLPTEYDYISLQKEIRPEDLAAFQGQSLIRHFGDELQDLSETAALCVCMDQIISVDTSVAHLSGAIGIPTKVLLPFNPDWRWQLDRDDSPWYASMHLYRQQNDRTWDSVLQKVASDLRSDYPQLPAKAEKQVKKAQVGRDKPGRDKNAIAPAATAARLKQAIRFHQAQQFAEAGAIYEEIIARDPKHFEALNLLAGLCTQLEHHERAIELVSRAVAINPQHPHTQLNRAICLHEGKQLTEALDSINIAIRLKPDYANAYLRKAGILRELGRFEEALECVDLTLKLRPNFPEALSERGIALNGLKRYEEAIAFYSRAIELKPDFSDAFSNRGNVHKVLRNFPQAIRDFETALQIKPNVPEIYSNLGNTYMDMHEFAKADASFQRAISILPDYPLAHYNLSMMQRLVGDYENGWKNYEWRWHREATPPRQFTQALWLGETDLHGKTILLHSEQGLGDTIQFCRYALLAKQAGAKVILDVQHAVVRLLKDLPWIDHIVANGNPLPPFDLHCPLLSLPLAFKTTLQTIPLSQAYLHAKPALVQAWKTRLGPQQKPRIGVVWSGNPIHKNDHNRSLPLCDLIASLPDGFEYISLQKELRGDDSTTMSQQSKLRHFGEQLRDFIDTAALIACMDLVISVDTSVAHLSAAMGKTTWILLAHTPDWRWLLDRSDSPWYESVKLYRQSADYQWQPLLTQVAQDLSALQQSALGLAAPLPAAKQQHAEKAPAKASAQAVTTATNLALKKAVALHQAGHLDQARTAYEQILLAQPQHFECLNLLANLLSQIGDFAAALSLIEQALQQKPDHAGAHMNRALCLAEMNQHEAALQSLDIVLRSQANLVSARLRQAQSLSTLGRFAEALDSLNLALQHKPDYIEALAERGQVLLALNRPTEAIATLQSAIAAKPAYLPALIYLAKCYRSSKQWELGKQQIEQVLSHDPHNLEARLLRVVFARELRLSSDVIHELNAILQQDPSCAQAYTLRAQAFRDQGEFKLALADYQRALELHNSSAENWVNVANILVDLREFEQAMMHYDRALSIAPNLTTARFNKANALLLNGDLQAAWPLYEARWQREDMRSLRFDQPAWSGQQSLQGKTILLYAEQGLGDTIQFSRYVQVLANRGAKVVLLAQAPLKRFLHRLSGIDRVISTGDVIPEFDYHCALLSLPLALNTSLQTIPANPHYLTVEPTVRTRWQSLLATQLGTKVRHRIGLVWSGNPQHSNDRQRSLPLASLVPHLSEDVDYFCLQKEVRPEDLVTLENTPRLHWFPEQMHDFEETAALCEQMDLIITVDTSVAHLAAALGKPTWILLASTPDWRWMLERDDSPWYPSVRLFRQTRVADWEDVLEQVNAALKQQFQ
ncbi:tetratricopeptide repeat protein [Undibacterium sp. FT137W]|uniref:Tetratricopeptide repeat protein n=2 Tax=Undibacterium fentianense TaxID=2828728 RepID=A0A941E3V1_9BURK|nr:tetratricopeptide repeat protein [Undibacterium fentianense]